MWLQLRAWWYVRGKEKKTMPRDVREYVIRRYMKDAIATLKTQEDKDRFVTNLMEGALGLENDQISPELRNELIRTAFELIGDARAPPLPKPPDTPLPTDKHEE